MVHVRALHNEIWQNVIRQACGDEDGTDDYRIKRQATLTNLMYVSRLFYQLSTTELYKDCLVRDSAAFFEGLNNPNSDKLKHLSNVETLRLCHETEFDIDPAYFRIMDDDVACWNLCGEKWCPNDKGIWSDFLRIRKDAEREKIGDLTREMSKAVEKGLDVLPRLKSCVMMGDGDDIEGDTILEQSVVDHLIGLRNVKHYCQKSIFGHLSIANVIYWPLHPPQVVTSHISAGDFLLFMKNYQLPIIIGATNRYVYVHCWFVEEAPMTLLDVTDDLVDELNERLHQLLIFRGTVMRQVKSDGKSGERESHVELIPRGALSLDGTSIELYNFVAQGAVSPITGEPIGDTFPIASEVLRAIEQRLDQGLGPWEGKVKLFNLVDTPLCPACGKPETTSVDG